MERTTPKYHIEEINGDNHRPGMPEQGWLVRHRPHPSYGWLCCTVCESLEQAETFAKTL